MVSFFLMAGVSYLFFALALFDSGRTIGAYAPWLFVVFSFPHFMATYWVWISRVKSWRNEWLPVLFPFLYSFIFLSAHQGWFGESGIETLLKFSYLYLLYHFAQQLYGVTLWMNLQNKILYSQPHKLLLRMVFLSACFYSWLEMEMRGAVNVLFYHSVSSWNLPSGYIHVGFIIVFGLTMAAMSWSFFDFFKTKNIRNLLAIAPVGLAWIWFLPPLNQNMILLLPIFHSLQYLPFIHMKGRKLSKAKWVGLSIALIAAGWFFFRWIPFHLPTRPLTGTLWPALVLTILNNHHFVIDGRIWKLKDPENRDLLTSAPELQSPKSQAQS